MDQMIIYSYQTIYDIEIMYQHLLGLNLHEHQNDDTILYLDDKNLKLVHQHEKLELD
jgi:hypothetical protein